VLVAVCALLGLVIGSFLNVVIARFPQGRSLGGRSACPRCGRLLTPAELVPVVSWLVQRRRCRGCRAPISAQYPAVELATAAAFAGLGARFDLTLELAAYLVATAFLVALSVIDLHTRTLPRRLIYAGAAASLPLLALAALVADEPRRIATLAGGSLAAGAFFLVLHVASPGAMGFGDVRLSFLLGALLGWIGLLHVPVGLFLGFLTGAVVGAGLMVVGRAGRKTAIPFGPFLAVGAYAGIVASRAVIDAWGV
jgi:leader peptidase (prepilin peptidase)/N-methyltransferase